MVWRVQLPAKKKGVIVALFGLRIFCPITIIPSLLSTRHLYVENDFTWLAVEPIIWQLVSYSLAIITSCIPSLKYVLDSFGSSVLAIEAPYELTTNAGRRGFHATPIGNNSGIETFGSQRKNVKGGLRGSFNQQVKAESGSYRKWLDGESMQDLTGGDAMIKSDDVDRSIRSM
ncbi:hypothetical protein MCOR24_010560 [Pyricularia oryzae]|nr:hypothetical protein MCOR24_010560 [Pyricularia oryzae]